MANTKITSRVLADDAVLTANITDDAVTSAKLDTNIDIAGTFDVTGATTLDSTLAVAGDANFDSGTLFVDVSENKVGIKTTSPVLDLQVGAAATGVDANMFLAAGVNAYSRLYMGDATTGTGLYAGLIMYDHGNDEMSLFTSSTQRVTIGSGGEVGIGATSPNSILEVESTQPNIRLTDSDNTHYARLGGSAGDLLLDADLGNGQASSKMTFGVDGTERMRIDDTGDIRFGIANAALTTTEVHTFYNGSKGNNLGLYTQGADQHFSIDMWNHTGGSCNQVQFRGGQHGAVTGTITSTGNNATQYNTSSDYRLKENVNYTWDATTRLKQLKPAQFNWISDETNTAVDGFLAHEVSSVVPQAVTGEKDAVYEDGEPKYQGIDHSVLVPLLVKTIQELEARIKTLEDA
jgi:hypothetical protein